MTEKRKTSIVVSLGVVLAMLFGMVVPAMASAPGWETKILYVVNPTCTPGSWVDVQYLSANPATNYTNLSDTWNTSNLNNGNNAPGQDIYTNGTYSATAPGSYTSDWGFIEIPAGTQVGDTLVYTETLVMDGTTVLSYSFTFDCSTGLPPGLMNRTFGDDVAVLKNHAANKTVEVWCISSKGVGTLAATLDKNTTSGTAVTGCRRPIVFYILNTGEYQVNIGPDQNGTTISVIWRGFPASGVYFKKFSEK